MKKKETTRCRIYYHDIGDYLSREEKLQRIGEASLEKLEWKMIQPNEYGDWINQRGSDFRSFTPMSSGSAETVSLFRVHGPGISTNRDAWAYGFSYEKVAENVSRSIEFFNSAIGKERQPDPTNLKWSANFTKFHNRGISLTYDSSAFAVSAYRPFQTQNLYIGPRYLERPKLLSWSFPTPLTKNVGIYVSGVSANNEFSVLATDLPPNLHFQSSGQFFSRWVWEPETVPGNEPDLLSTAASLESDQDLVDGYRRVDNITDEILTVYQEALGEDVTKDDIFYFVYGQLHDPGYREAYAADLKKMLPHIQTPTDRARFDQLAAAGNELMNLHVGYEDVKPWPLDIQLKTTVDPKDRETWRMTKLRWNKIRDPKTKKDVDDRTTIIYNSKVKITDIPVEASEYKLGARSALAWVIDRYQVKMDDDSGIVNDPNDWADTVGNPRYIVDLIGKVTRVAMETVRIVNSIDNRSDLP